MSSRITHAAMTAIVAVLAISAGAAAGIDEYPGQSEREQQLQAAAQAGFDDAHISVGAYYIVPRVSAVGSPASFSIPGAIPVCVGSALAGADAVIGTDDSSLRVWVDGQPSGCAAA